MKNIFTPFIFLSSLLVFSCAKEKAKADLIIYNAVIYSVDSVFTKYEAMAIKNGKILDLGNNEDILKNYSATESSDVKGKVVVPGIIDAHCHFVGYGLGLSQVNLISTSSFNEVLSRVVSFSNKNKVALDDTSPQTKETKNSDNGWIIGRGWDQNDWVEKKYPSNKELDSLFPNRPVLLTRVDGHAALVNSYALKMAGITAETKISGGEFIKSGNRLTGVLIDRAVDFVTAVIPPVNEEEMMQALLSAQDNCLAVGLTTVDDAGIMKSDVDLIDALQKSGKLKMRVYAMLRDSLANYDYFLKSGPLKTERLNVRSFKFYADGALGSRGACLFKDYSDKPGWKGFLLTPRTHFEKYAEILDKEGFQMNTHCIGDSAVNMVIGIYERYCNEKNNHRWRIEHSQIINDGDFKRFSLDIIPSVQPTHATSDMYWAGTRLGKERLENSYAHKKLLKESGILALGTDFPVEDISPFKTFYAAVARKDKKGLPANGFQIENALSREETLRGITIWAAYSNFEEHEKGSLEKGKLADFIVLDKDLMTCDINDVLKIKVLSTYINGEKVFSLNN